MKTAIVLSLAALTFTAPAGIAQEAQYETTEITDGVYRFRFQGHNGFFVVTEPGVVAVDPISEEAAAVYAEEIQRVAPGATLRAVVYSHDHADHATGARVLMEVLGEASVIAHENANAPIAERGDPAQPTADVTFAERYDLDSGSRPIELRYLGPNHSDNTLVVFLPRQKIAFAVDFVAHDRLGYRDLPSFYFPELLESFRRLQELEYETIVFGHGPSGDRSSVDRQAAYYRDLRDAVAEAIETGWSEDEAAERVRLPGYSDWGQYDAWLELNVRKMYQWLSEP